METEAKIDTNQPLVHEFNQKNDKSLSPKIIALVLGVVVLGIVTGFLLSGNNKSKSATSNGNILNLSSITKGTVIGSNDTSTFKDTAEGILKTGGIEDEGAFHLVRPGGDSQNVYLTSSSVDLSKIVGKKIKVWGQTQKAQHAGWLMDVGKVEIL